jgi:hypothetical protein
MSVIIGPYVVGERPSSLTYQFLNSSGAVIDISGFTAKLNYQERDGAAVSVNASVSDGPNGKATYAFTGSEFATAGHYRAQFIVGNGTNRFISVDITFDVAVPVGTVPNI